MSAGPATATAQPSTIGSADVRAYLHRCSAALRRHRARLTMLDARLGDGDHGDNMVHGFRAVEQMLAETSGEPLVVGELLRRTGHCLVSAVGGASGPLYGTAFVEAGFVAGSRDELSPVALAEVVQAAADGLARRGRCRVGDKTILDTLAPAAEALLRGADDDLPLPNVVEQMVRAAHEGMLSTRALVARRGLALRLGPRSAGHLDPGAVSCYLLLRSMVA